MSALEDKKGLTVFSAKPVVDCTKHEGGSILWSDIIVNWKSVNSSILSVPIIPFIFMAYRECGDVETPVSSVVFGEVFRQ